MMVERLLQFSLALLLFVGPLKAQDYVFMYSEDLPRENIPAEIILPNHGDVVYAIEDVGRGTRMAPEYTLVLRLSEDMGDRQVVFDSRKEESYDIESVESVFVDQEEIYLIGAYRDTMGGRFEGIFRLNDNWEIEELLASVELQDLMSYADKDCYYIHHLQEYHCTLSEDILFERYVSHIRAIIGREGVSLKRHAFPAGTGSTARAWLDTLTTNVLVYRGDSLVLLDREMNVLLTGFPAIQLNGANNIGGIIDVLNYEDSVATLMGYELGVTASSEGQLATYTFDFRTGRSALLSEDYLTGEVSPFSMKYSLSDKGEVTFFQYDNSTLSVGDEGAAHLWVYDRDRNKVDSLALDIGPARLISVEEQFPGCYVGSALVGKPPGPTRLLYWKAKKTTSTQETIDLDVKLYPNPADDDLTLDHPELSDGEVRIYTIEGALVKEVALEESTKTTQIDIQDLPAGSYALRVVSNKGVFSQLLQVH